MLSTAFSIQVAREIFYGISLQAFYNFYESHNILIDFVVILMFLFSFLMMFVDLKLIFVVQVSYFNISCIRYELRVVIWSTTDVILQEQSILGEKMSDIFVKA